MCTRRTISSFPSWRYLKIAHVLDLLQSRRTRAELPQSLRGLPRQSHQGIFFLGLQNQFWFPQKAHIIHISQISPRQFHSHQGPLLYNSVGRVDRTSYQFYIKTKKIWSLFPIRATLFFVFIGPESDHWLCLSLTHWLTDSLTDSCLVNLIDVTLACEDAFWRLVEVVTVVDVSDEDRVGNSLLQIWKLRFGQKAKLMFRLWAQGLVKILKLKFRQDFKAGVCSAFCRWCLVEFMKLNLGRHSKARFGQYFEF